MCNDLVMVAVDFWIPRGLSENKPGRAVRRKNPGKVLRSEAECSIPLSG